jgi:threonine aldolase
MAARIDVDLFSDTVTRPTPEMRRFMCDAEVGDEQKFEDPTVNLLQEMVADLLGKEAALFLPSGTMCNEIAIRVHCRPGDEMIAHRTAHPIHFESGGPAALAGVNVSPLTVSAGSHRRRRGGRDPAPRGPLPAGPAPLGGADLESGRRSVPLRGTGEPRWPAVTAWHPHGRRAPDERGGGERRRTRDYAAPFDPAWIDFTRGSARWRAIAGSRAIAEARGSSSRWGYGRPTSSRRAAFALRYNVKRLAEDHANARRPAEGLASCPRKLRPPRWRLTSSSI